MFCTENKKESIKKNKRLIDNIKQLLEALKKSISTIPSKEYVNELQQNVELGMENLSKVFDDTTANLLQQFNEVKDRSDNINKVTWEELVLLKTDKKLVPGSYYRIIDYSTIVLAENIIQSEYNKIDIIALAVSEDTLSEDVTFAQNENDTYYKNRNVLAWKGKYCLENDVTRFGWLNTSMYYISSPDYDTGLPIYRMRTPEYDKEGYFAWTAINTHPYNVNASYLKNESLNKYCDFDDIIYTETEDSTPIIFYYTMDLLLVDMPCVVYPVSKGAIYYLCDEYNNKTSFDYTSLMFTVSCVDRTLSEQDPEDPDTIIDKVIKKQGYLFSKDLLQKGEVVNNTITPYYKGTIQIIPNIILSCRKTCSGNYFGNKVYNIYINADTITNNSFEFECHTNHIKAAEFVNNKISLGAIKNYIDTTQKIIGNNISYNFAKNTIKTGLISCNIGSNIMCLFLNNSENLNVTYYNLDIEYNVSNLILLTESLTPMNIYIKSGISGGTGELLSDRQELYVSSNTYIYPTGQKMSEQEFVKI